MGKRSKLVKSPDEVSVVPFACHRLLCVRITHAMPFRGAIPFRKLDMTAFDAEAAGLPDPDNGPFASAVYRIGVVTQLGYSDSPTF